MRSIAIVGGLSALIGACSGKAVIDPAEDTGSGGATSSASGNNSSSSGQQARCDGINDCCEDLCDAATALPCWNGQTDCECDVPAVPDCRDEVAALYQCMVTALPNSLACFEGEMLIACDTCQAQIDAIPVECGFDIGRCAP